MPESLYVNNFKTLQNFTLNFEEDENAILLIGRNGTGKTNIARVFNMLRQIAAGSVDVAELTRSC